MTDALQERIDHEVRFTADVSHELRSPLTTLATSLGVLESHRDELPPRSRHALDLLSAELHRFQRMVDDLLEISRVDTGSAELSLDEVEVGELARRGRGGRRGGRRPRRRGPVARGGTPVGGQAAHRARRDEPGGQRGAVRRRCDPPRRRTRVRPRRPLRGGRPRAGCGTGRARQDLRTVLPGPGRGPTRRGHDGTGLGLSLVAEHVRLHGGRVWAEPGADGENRFVIELPTMDPQASALAPDPHLGRASGLRQP